MSGLSQTCCCWGYLLLLAVILWFAGGLSQCSALDLFQVTTSGVACVQLMANVGCAVLGIAEGLIMWHVELHR